ncbi:xanthine dehydrogenase family protein molybdopterin-binding subunit [Lysobacter capsici]|uniref:xanthine dehydrogenase family protein molybdopterin-binding subunit n=1 Tax=Lysobacter capsici TaxID=435897 RepID=UPI00287B8B37|nr:molybdopterin cofactor-binding domain-containing protein [Lysobacter capsici]WND81846.1 molybdopterin cofactor-binding domain-containing protein [Lysobacter capsici]WND87043.1 molybdopterin cofactor-binding domain-containing protein [Lysobacter capsici]
MPARLSRRDFLKCSVVAGITVYVAAPGSAALAALFEKERLRPMPWDPATGRIRYRTDATAKVTGEKLFSYDMRAHDLPGWPREQAHAMLLRLTQADRVYQDFDLSSLPADLQPDRTVTAADLARDGVAFPPFYGEDLLLPEGKTPAYLGQAVALLIWNDFARFRAAKSRLKFRDELIRWGAQTGPVERDPWATFRYVRVGGASAFDDDAYSSYKDTVLFPSGYKKHNPQWATGDAGGKLDAQGIAYADAMAAELDRPGDGKLVFEREYFSQSIDTAAMELDNGNGWFDAATGTLHLVSATQSPNEIAEDGPRMLAATKFGVKRLVLHPCYTVGYGSKDHNAFPFVVLMAALYGGGRPVRLANDRYEQFQSSLKRHSFRMHYRLKLDRASGRFEVLQGRMLGDGGGRMNFSPSVCLVAATAAQSIYYFPRSDLSSTVIASRALDAGSARGYGTLQSMGATEMLIDEIAAELKLDPIELRLRNVFATGMKNTQGAIPAGLQRADEVLKKSREHPLWTQRAKRKAEYDAAHPGKRYGVGFGCVQKDYGTGGESAFAEVALSRDGRIALRHTGIEMGTGMATSQAAVCAQWLGRPADEVLTGETQWPELPMVATDDPWLMSQATQDAHVGNPRWTPNYASPSSASNSSYFFSHASREAARLLFTQGLWPAAQALWSQGFGGGQLAPLVARREDARWVEGKLSAAGLQPLSLQQLAAKAYELGLATGAVVHYFNRWQWTEAEFPLRDDPRLPLDGLALRWGDGSADGPGTPTANGYRIVERTRVFYPPVQRNNAGVVYYSAIGTIAEVAVDIATGHVDLLNHHSILECGNQIVPELVSSQLQGGVAMGIGHALHEFLPLYEGGPGDGTWNFNRYTLPRARDVAVWRQTGEVLPPLSPTDAPKGMAEVVMIPIVPAIANAIAHATGLRLRELPITADKILAAHARAEASKTQPPHATPMTETDQEARA